LASAPRTSPRFSRTSPTSDRPTWASWVKLPRAGGNAAEFVGQTPWSARVPLDPLFARRVRPFDDVKGRRGRRPRTRGSALLVGNVKSPAWTTSSTERFDAPQAGQRGNIPCWAHHGGIPHVWSVFRNKRGGGDAVKRREAVS
jgi:hypothetical protein